MNPLRRLLLVSICLLHAATAATPADTQRLEKKWQLTMEQWALETRVATTPEALAKVWAARPDATPIARQMWGLIGPSLNDEWTIEPAAWFVRVAAELCTTNTNGSNTPTFAKEIEAIRKASETTHLKSTKLIPLCMALAMTRDPRSLAVLDSIQSNNPDPKIQGVAALGAAMILKTLGDDSDLMRKRLTCLRKAIIQSSDVALGDSTVAKLAEDELYIIRFLTKGRVAPDLSGTDSANRPLKLSDHQGKVIVLIFWNSTMPEAARVVQITAPMITKFRDRPFVIIGVNNDPLDKLRTMEADGTITWQNLSDPSNKLADAYRVGTWPLVYVLDGERKIHYAGAPGSFTELTAEALLAEIKPASE